MSNPSRQVLRLLLPSLLLALLTACGKSRDTPRPTVAPEREPFVLGDLIEPFEPPTLAELDGRVKWEDQPVEDGVALLRQRQEGESPLVSTAAALQLRNDSPEANDQILSALGRLPEGAETVNWNATWNRHSAADVKSTNPIMIDSTVEFDIVGLTAFGLFSFDWTLRPFAVKDTVASWQSSEDRLYDKVVLRDDLTWSDGEPITAHDVVFSYKVIMSSQVPVPAMRSGTDKIKWVEAYDDRTLVFFHKEALATNIWNINFGVIPKHVYEKTIAEDPTLQSSAAHVQIENNPVSGGPYVIASRSRGQELLLTRRESWYMHNGTQVREKPYFKDVRFRVIQEPSVALLALKAGDIDEQILNPEQWQTQTNDDDFYKNNTKVYAVEWLYFYFGWNNRKPWFSDPRVRQAMSYAFDHKELLTRLRYGLDQPCNGIFHKTSRWAPKDAAAPYERDLDKAEALLDEAGWTDSDGDGIRDKLIDGRPVKFEFSVLTSNRQDRVDICNLLQQSLDQIGIICHVRPIEFTVLQEKTRTHDFDAYFGGWGTGTDPDTSENLWATGQERNFVQYSNPQVDELFVAGRKEFDPEKRAEIYGQIHKQIYADQPYTFLYFQNAYYGFNKSLRGYVFSPRGPYHFSPGVSSIWKPAAQ